MIVSPCNSRSARFTLTSSPAAEVSSWPRIPSHASSHTNSDLFSASKYVEHFIDFRNDPLGFRLQLFAAHKES